MQIQYMQTSLNRRVVLAWCPGHTGIAENDQVDVAAKSAMRSSHKQTYVELVAKHVPGKQKTTPGENH
jgi:ribonuclease HI